MKIKPLEWEECGESLYHRIQAETAFGLVRIYDHGRDIDWPPRSDPHLRTACGSQAKAKAYVQEKHESRIRSFIEGGTDDKET